MIYLAEVISVDDKSDGERIQAKVLPEDRFKPEITIAYSFPYLPKYIHIKPKVGETVAIICSDDENQNSQRWYIGPIISQPQYMNFDNHVASSTRLLKGGILPPDKAPSVNPETNGTMAKDDEIALYSRGDSDLILGEKDVRLRCGVKKFANNKKDFEFNKKNPSFVKLTEHKTPMSDDTDTSATIVSENINLISPVGDVNFNVFDRDCSVSDETVQEMIDKAHSLPYGDVLVDFLTMFLQMFKSHTHKYANLPPCPDDASKKLDMKYGTGTGLYNDDAYDYSRGNNEMTRYEDVNKTFRGLGEKLLSKHVRIN